MAYLRCGCCGLEIKIRASSLAIQNCPRCIARRAAAVPLQLASGPRGASATSVTRPPGGLDGGISVLAPAQAADGDGRVPRALVATVVAREVERQQPASDRAAGPRRSVMDAGTVVAAARSVGIVTAGRVDSLPSDPRLDRYNVAAGRARPIPFEVGVRPNRRAVHLEPVGELDLATRPRLQAQVGELLERGFDQLVIDLRGLVFIDVAGVRLLLTLRDAAYRDGWRLSLIQGPSAVRRVFALTRTLDSLPFGQAGDAGTRGQPAVDANRTLHRPTGSAHWVG